MAKSNAVRKVESISTKGEWICRDGNKYIVDVPTPGGRRYFLIEHYGSTVNALKAARKYHNEMEKQLRFDQAYFRKHGEKVQRFALNARNTSGYHAISRVKHANLDGSSRVTFTVTWQDKHGWPLSKSFSTTQYKGHEDYALEAAIKWRDSVRPELKDIEKQKG